MSSLLARFLARWGHLMVEWRYGNERIDQRASCRNHYWANRSNFGAEYAAYWMHRHDPDRRCRQRRRGARWKFGGVGFLAYVWNTSLDRHCFGGGRCCGL